MRLSAHRKLHHVSRKRDNLGRIFKRLFLVSGEFSSLSRKRQQILWMFLLTDGCLVP